MRTWTAVLVVVACGAALGAAGCGRKVPTLAPGDSWHTKFRASDLQTGDMNAEFGLAEGELQTAIALAKPDNCVDGMGMPTACYEFTRFDCHWLAVLVDNPGSATVRAAGTRDYMMICQAPDATLFGSDDFDTIDCVNNGICDPGITLAGAGTWTCFFTVSPYDTVFFPNNAPVGGDITVSVE
jgi:hypothetical protein